MKINDCLFAVEFLDRENSVECVCCCCCCCYCLSIQFSIFAAQKCVFVFGNYLSRPMKDSVKVLTDCDMTLTHCKEAKCAKTVRI